MRRRSIIVSWTLAKMTVIASAKTKVTTANAMRGSRVIVKPIITGNKTISTIVISYYYQVSTANKTLTSVKTIRAVKVPLASTLSALSLAPVLQVSQVIAIINLLTNCKNDTNNNGNIL